MKIYTIKIASFVDLITNSSSEVFISAHEGTVKAIKNIVNSMLKLSNSSLTCDDLFEFQLGVYDPEEWKKPKFYDTDSERGKEIIESGEEDNGYNGVEVELKVIAKNENAKEAAKLLEGLNHIFQMEGVGK